jgi:hypothetical protein
MSRTCLYFKQEPETDRWLPGDRFFRPLIRQVIRGKPKYISGVDRIFVNLCTGLDRLDVRYEINLPFSKLKDDDRVGVMGRGRHVLACYDRPNVIVAGPYLMTHPSEWPTLCQDFRVGKYLQHCEWANDIYKPYFGERCTVWAHGVDTGKWAPSPQKKDLDVLLYDKVRWDREKLEPTLIQPIREALQRRSLKFAEIRYGFYNEDEYRNLLARTRAMVFLVEHESQGSACQECLSCDVPILAWDQGWYRDPARLQWGGEPDIPVSSVPYFDARCGRTFKSCLDFEGQLDCFWQSVKEGELRPREFVLENLTLEKCARDYLRILEESVAVSPAAK